MGDPHRDALLATVLRIRGTQVKLHDATPDCGQLAAGTEWRYQRHQRDSKRDMMASCKRCGKQIPEGQITCAQCARAGGRIGEPAREATVVTSTGRSIWAVLWRTFLVEACLLYLILPLGYFRRNWEVTVPLLIASTTGIAWLLARWFRWRASSDAWWWGVTLPIANLVVVGVFVIVVQSGVLTPLIRPTPTPVRPATPTPASAVTPTSIR